MTSTLRVNTPTQLRTRLSTNNIVPLHGMEWVILWPYCDVPNDLAWLTAMSHGALQPKKDQFLIRFGKVITLVVVVTYWLFLINVQSANGFQINEDHKSAVL